MLLFLLLILEAAHGSLTEVCRLSCGREKTMMFVLERLMFGDVCIRKSDGTASLRHFIFLSSTGLFMKVFQELLPVIRISHL